MPLFDLFRKSSKKEAVQAPQQLSASSGDDSLFAPEMLKKRYEAAMEFLKYFQGRLPLVDGKPHPGTVLSVAARLAGTSLFRSLNYDKDIPPGVVVLSEEVNEAWPQLMNLFAYYGKQNGMDVMTKPPVTVFPEQDKPLLSVAEVQQEYQDQYHEIMSRHGLDDLNAARAGMIVCSIIFLHHCTVAKDIAPDVATGIIAMGVVEGAKTAPPPLGSGNPTGRKPQNEVRNNDRLVLGEREAVLQETRAHGGIYIDPPPSALEMLKLGKIDPYIIYEQGMRNQIEKQIPRIDFVAADVDRLFDKWKSQPDAPIHIRLIVWLKNNAKMHGYEQDGNSWVLKK